MKGPSQWSTFYLGAEELGEALRETTLLTGQDHLQHVAMELLHDHEDPLRSLKHARQVDDAGVVKALRRSTATRERGGKKV